MAKKDKNKKDTKTVAAPNPVTGGRAPGTVAATAAYNTQITQTTVTTSGKGKSKKDKKAEAKTKEQLAEYKKKNAGVDLNNLTPEQLAQLQLEEAIKESTNPSANLKKLRNPLGIRGCLLNLLFFIILTFGVVVLICYIQIDNFNLGVVLKDILVKFGIWDFFSWLFKSIGGWFK